MNSASKLAIGTQVMLPASTARQETRRHLLQSAFPRRPLTHLEFAEKYVKHATGPYKGFYFRGHRQPFVRLLFHELDAGGWTAIYVTGTSQSGKTLGAFVIPTLRQAVGLQEDALIGVPEADMAADKWDKDFLPTLNASEQLSWLVPTKGPGSKGGKIKDRITLGNGIDIKIMTRGGQDTNKAGYTARVIFVTEAKGWSGRSEKSSEANDLRKLIARQRSHKRKSRRLVVEGTVGVETELPWTARGGDGDNDPLISTKSRIECPCPHCEAFICPGRDCLVGWQEARTEWEVEDLACFVCPVCGMKITDAQRRAAMADCVLVHHGQRVQKGVVIGDPPPTSTLWFPWGAWHNCLLDAADTAIDEWKASQIEEGTQEREDAERELTQFAHAIPFKSTLAKADPLDARVIRGRYQQWQRGLLPHDTKFVTIGVDMGRWTGWWFAIAFRATGELHCPAYGAFDVCRNGQSDDEASRIVSSLAEFDQRVVQAGFPQEGVDGLRLPDAVMIDMNYLPDNVAEFVRAQGKGWNNRYKCGRGAGSSLGKRKRNAGYHHPHQLTIQRPKAGTQWFVEMNYERRIPEITFNADFWLTHLHDRLRIAPGNKGALTLYVPNLRNEHAKVSNHLAAEELKKAFDPEKGGIVEKWICKGDNHWGDAAKMALVMGDWLGFRLAEIDGPPPAPQPEPDNFWDRRAA
jgi:hypothetical protein